MAKLMKVAVVSCFHEEVEISRSYIVQKRLESLGFDARVLCSDFSHATRSRRKFCSNSAIPIPTISYYGSLTLHRMLSHFFFCLMTFFALVRLSPKLVYCNVPPNGLCWVTYIYAKLFRRKLIFDVIDIWPEALAGVSVRLSRFSKLFALMGRLSRYPLCAADYVVLECQKFQNLIDTGLVPTKVVSLCKPGQAKTLPPTATLSIAYLGGLGSIYDFASLFTIASEIRKFRDVEIHLLGEGPMKDEFLHRFSLLDVKLFYYGASFDEEYKFNCLSACWFGFNMYHRDEFIGLSYKAVDYLSFGLPLLNSLRGDLHDVISHFNAGRNVSKDDLPSLISYLAKLNQEQVLEMKSNAMKAFESNYSLEKFERSMADIMSFVIRQ